jgi:hypothetical protein
VTGEPAGQEAVDEPALADPRPLVDVAVGEPSQRQRDGPLFEHGGAAGRMHGPRQGDEVPPPDAARLDGHDEPLAGLLPPGQPRAHLPAREDLLLAGRGHLRGDDVVGEGLEHDRRAEGLGQLTHDEVGG